MPRARSEAPGDPPPGASPPPRRAARAQKTARKTAPSATPRSAQKTARKTAPSATPKSASTRAPKSAGVDAGPSVEVDLKMVQGLARGASRIVSQAAQILEEELSAGIGAAKQIERRFLNVAEMRATSPDEVMARFRKDAHEVVDIVLDLINVPTRSLGDITNRIAVGEPVARRGTPAPRADAPTIALPDDVPPGSSGAVPFSLENDGDIATAEFVFQATDLVSANGEKIPARQVTFNPSKLRVPPHDRESVTIKIAVPVGTAPGTYSGLVLASKQDRLRAVLVVNVE